MLHDSMCRKQARPLSQARRGGRKRRHQTKRAARRAQHNAGFWDRPDPEPSQRLPAGGTALHRWHRNRRRMAAWLHEAAHPCMRPSSKREDQPSPMMVKQKVEEVSSPE